MVTTLALITALASATAGGCSWEHPGANPYRGDPIDVLADFALPDRTRQRLADMMRAHRFTDLATITRNSVEGAWHYENLRQMHSGHGVVCHGTVDRSRWDAGHVERALVYCADDACVLVPTVCNNVSLVTRIEPARPQENAAIDISPRAGPVPSSSTPTHEASDEVIADAWVVPPASVPHGSPEMPPGAPACCSFAPPPWTPFDMLPPIRPTPSGGESHPPPGGGTPVASPVPEMPTWVLMMTAVVAFIRRLRRASNGHAARRQPLFGLMTAAHDQPAGRR